MRLNPECVRDVLLFLEDNLKITTQYLTILEEEDTRMIPVSFLEMASDEKMEKHDRNDIFYSCQKLIEARFITPVKGLTFSNPDECVIADITYNGHEFLNNIRDENTWKQALSEVSGKVGSASLSIISQVAAKFLASALGLS